MFKSLLERYTESNTKTGKVITSAYEEKDIISRKGSVKVTSETQVGEPFSLYLTRLITEQIIVTQPVVIDTNTVYINSPVLPVVGNTLCLKQDNRFSQTKIITVTPVSGQNYILGVDSPFDYAFQKNSGCSLTSSEMNINGSITPVRFSISPVKLTIGTEWDIHGFTVHIIDDATMDDTKFGGIAALAKGVVARASNGITKNLGNFKRNGDFGDLGFRSEYVDKTGGGQYSIRAYLDLTDVYGSSIAMVSSDPQSETDYFEGIIQDDLSALSSMHVVLHGHIVNR